MSSDDKERGSDSRDYEVAATLLEEPSKEDKEADSDYEDDARDPQPYRLDPSAPEIGIAISALKALALTSRNRPHVTLQKEAGIATSNGVLYSHAVLVYLEHVVDGDGSTAVSEKIAEFSLGARSPSLVHRRGLTIRHLASFSFTTATSRPSCAVHTSKPSLCLMSTTSSTLYWTLFVISSQPK